MFAAIAAFGMLALTPVHNPGNPVQIDRDVRCMAAFFIHQATEERSGKMKKDEEADIRSFVLYYLGAIQAQDIDYDVGAAINRKLEDDSYVHAGYLHDLERCSNELSGNVDVLNRIGNSSN